MVIVVVAGVVTERGVLSDFVGVATGVLTDFAGEGVLEAGSTGDFALGVTVVVVVVVVVVESTGGL